MESGTNEIKLFDFQVGKLRRCSGSDPNALLFIATDRISAYDVILTNVGALLTEISRFWFAKLAHIIPNHFITADIDAMPAEIHEYKAQLEGRAMLVGKAQVVPLEAIVRGYLTGSACAEYQKSGTVHGISLPAGLRESERLPTPLFTPSTKADIGAHDENISPQQAAALIGDALYAQISTAALALYTAASEHAHARGLILADTKFEFGLVPASGETQELILPAAVYEAGRAQPSFDKQYLRDWLVGAGFRKGLEAGPKGSVGKGWAIEESVVEGTRKRYEEVVAMLTAA
ncbi:phosphoribosylaminoimidazole-succinocarboxamide synthase [Mycena olivaceomarginata]|nr:phosphoribosylaminoimidazole-succinocarboxamide synthase [Mycena olivaceomarginata]